MRKVIIATHYTLAKGFQETLNYLTGDDDSTVQAICAYLHNDDKVDLKKKINSMLNSEDEFYILTDLSFGSVSQTIAQFASDKVHIIAGINLPLAMSITLAVKNNLPIDINQMIDEAKKQLIYVNSVLITDEQNLDDE